MILRFMKGKLIYFIIQSCCVCVLTMGCSYKLTIVVTGDNPFEPSFALTKPCLSSPIGKNVSLNSFGVYAKSEDAWDYKNPVWSFELERGSFREVSAIRYGSVPVGFDQKKIPGELKAGVPYLILARGAGGSGTVEFEITKQDNGSYTIEVRK